MADVERQMFSVNGYTASCRNLAQLQHKILICCHHLFNIIEFYWLKYDFYNSTWQEVHTENAEDI